MEFHFISLLLSLLITFFITYLVGHTLLSFIKIPNNLPFTKEFTKLCLGFYTIITTYSIYNAKGITINLGVFILGIFLFFWFYKNNYLRKKDAFLLELTSFQTIPYIGVQLLIIVLVFIYLFLKLHNPLQETTYLVYGDFYNYAKVIEQLKRTGVESSFIDWHSTTAPNRNLYHFGELWYSAFFSMTTSQTPFFVFYLHLFSICLLTYFLGACTLLEVFIQPKIKYIYLISISILFICGISFYIPRTTIFTNRDWWDNSLLFQPKYIFSTIFIFYAFIFYQKKLIVPLIVTGMATILVCTVVAPAILISVTLILFLLFFTKRILFRTLIKYSVPIVFTLIFIGCYTIYIHYLNDLNLSTEHVQKSYSVPASIGYYIKTAFNCFAGQIIKSVLSLFPFIILLFLYYRKQKKYFKSLLDISIVFIIIHISSLLSYAIFFNRVDAVQLWTNIYLPLSAIICFLVIAFVVNEKNKYLSAFAYALICLCFYQVNTLHSTQEINKEYAVALIKNYKGQEAVFFKSGNDFTSIFSKNINMYSPNPYLIMNFSSYNPICLTVFEIPKSNSGILKNAEEEIISNSVFYKFVETQKKNNHFVSIENSQVDFIKKHKIKYAFVYSNSRLPKLIEPYIQKEIKDTVDGIKFYTLKDI